MTQIRPRRTALYVPGSNQRALDKAGTLGADVLILDLEDAVAPTEKDDARRRVVEAAVGFRMSGFRGEVVIRCNGLDSPWGHADLAAIVKAAPDAVLIPKVSLAADIERVRAVLRATDAPRLPIWAMIETPRAVLDPLAIALSADEHWPLAALVLGLNDLARETRARQVAGRAPMMAWMMAALAAARVAGLDILDGVFNAIADHEGFVSECAAARDCGFDGKTVIHPSQIASCNAAFSPDATELALAKRIASVFDLPEHAGQGVVMVDGRMVERLHAEMARRTLAIAAAITHRSAG
ncbi:CoA ester lyase [Kaistia dalseonensis]|uniref:Citrate lyase subunit beta/citryl-CoA lyase n=1 Tax=Kaistia dalseonensis TaxID=410840 RepID=A0ABU0H4F9_9HYPH|nr:CoA ester lyase [Kaistia dalseonensis]MCX5494614.1 CoA ester lyase [Kaistia dalseonensis]MDQ0437194.1 citrate lyase subunit beta/citryl-CoA lyase [Kaistia dalseonensis]